ncbi:type III polyketide synthase [Sphingomonas tabacisoli]|uniref:Type III polyketide synthase n=1 Tax=Sphingomonas tabacisoli TaxID=2249466 RepID=A0ABW4HX65_9SPHN
MAEAFINAIGTAVPDQDIHQPFLDWALARIADPRHARLFERMVARSGLEHRWSVLPSAPNGGSPAEPGGFYGRETLPGTAERMRFYGEAAPALALRAIDALDGDLSGITHLVVASCTGFVAPGVDQIIARRLGLSPSVERLLVGYMGCYAASVALRSARHIVRSDPAARVLVVTVELCSLHLHEMDEIEPMLAGLQFGDGSAAALVTGDPHGLRLGTPFSATLPESNELIRWDITDKGFVMHLSGEVPGRIGAALAEPDMREAIVNGGVEEWGVHAGGRSILDAVENALQLPPDSLDDSRAVLRAFGNMSSSTLMFVLQRKFGRQFDAGVAIAFGPGLAAEGFRFASA